MYSYKDSIRSDVREWIEDNKDQIAGLDRHEAYEVIYDFCWMVQKGMRFLSLMIVG